MTNFIELAKAVAWPLATIVASFFALLITRKLASRQQGFRLTIPKIVDLSSDPVANEQISATESSASDPGQAALAPREPEAREAELQDNDSDDEQVSNTESDYFMATKDPNKLEELYTDFISTVAEEDDIYFWKTMRIQRRVELGLADELTELEELAQRERSNIWPLLYLVRRHKRFGDLAAAETALARASERLSPANTKWHHIEAIRLYWDLAGRERAYAYVKEILSSPVTDDTMAELLEAVAGYEEIEKDAFSNSPLMELELAFDEKRHARRFTLAFRYMDTPETKFLAFRHFRVLEHAAHEEQAVLNNLGVVSQPIGAAAQISYYEKAANAGNLTAVGNVANALIRAGFLDRAKILLEGTDDQSTSTIVSARQALVKAQIELEEKLTRYREKVKEVADRYRATLLRAFEYFKTGSGLNRKGCFASEDGSISVSSDSDQAIIEWTTANSLWKGTIKRKSIYYQGDITRSSSTGGAASLLSTESRTIAFLQIADEDAVLLWFGSASPEPTLVLRNLLQVIKGPEEGERSL